MTESGLFAITINCHPKLVWGSGPEEPRTWMRSVGTKNRSSPKDQGRLFAAFSGLSAFKPTAVLLLATWNKQLVTALHEGPRTALCSVQRVLALKRTADLWIEMLKQVHDDVCLTRTSNLDA